MRAWGARRLRELLDPRHTRLASWPDHRPRDANGRTLWRVRPVCQIPFGERAGPSPALRPRLISWSDAPSIQEPGVEHRARARPWRPTFRRRGITMHPPLPCRSGARLAFGDRPQKGRLPSAGHIALLHPLRSRVVCCLSLSNLIGPVSLSFRFASPHSFKQSLASFRWSNA